MGTFELASNFLSITLILGQIAQVSVRTTPWVAMNSSDEAFSSNSKVNLYTNETSGYPQKETEILSTEGLPRISFMNYSTHMISETISAFITSINTDLNSLELKSGTSTLQTVSSEDTSTFDLMAIMSTQLFSCMTCTQTTNWSVSARSDSLSIYTEGITSTATSGNASLETITSSTELNKKVTPLSSVILDSTFTFSASKYTGSTYTDISKMQTVSSEETTTFDLTILLSTEWSSSMTYTSITDRSASAWLDSLSTFTININNTETSENLAMKTDTEFTSLRLAIEASKMKTVTSEEISTFDSIVILSTQLSSNMTHAPETFSMTSSTSVTLETTSAFATLGKTESSYYRLDSKIQSVSSEETSILNSVVILSTQSSPNMTYTTTTVLSSFAWLDSLSKDAGSITSNELSGNAPTETETSSITMNETLSTLLSNTLSTSMMLEITFTFSASIDTKPILSGSNTDTAQMQMVSSDETSTFNSTSIQSTQLSSTMTYAPINLWSASTKMDVLSTSTVNTNGTETSGYQSLETGTSFTELNQTFSEIFSMISSTFVALETTSSFATLGKTESSYFGVDSKIQSMSSEETSILKSMAILSTQSSPNMTYTPTTGLSSFARSDSLSKDTVSINSNGISGNAPREMSFITMNETLSTLLSNTLSKSVMLETSFTFSASIDTKHTISGFNTDLSKMQTVSLEETSTFNSTSIQSTQLSSSMTYALINLWSASTKLDVLSILKVNTNSTETSGYPSLETDSSSTELNQTFSEIFSLTSSTSLALETTSSFATLGKTESSYFGVNSKIQSVSSDESSILTSMVILSTHSSPNMTYTPTTGLSSFARSDSLSKDTVSINSNGISGNAPREMSFITMNETLSTLLSNTLSKSVMLETSFTFSASIDTKHTISGFNTDLSKMQMVSLEETSTFNSTSIQSTQLSSSMTYALINLWSASTKLDVLSILKVNTNSTETSGYPSLETDSSSTELNQTFSEIFSLTSSTSLALETTSSFATLGKTESSYFGVNSKIQSVSSDESSILTSMVILSTHSSPNMTYTPTTGLSSFARSDSLSKDTVSIKSNGISGNAPTETSFITMNETLSTLLSNTLSKSVMLETTFTFSASLDTKPTLSGFNTDLSKMQTVSSEESTTFNSTSIRSTQLYSTMTYTPINLWSASTKMDVLSILTVNTNGTEISGYPSLETGTSFTGLNQTFSEIVSLTSSTSLALETTSSFATLGKTESNYFGVDSKIQSVSSDESSILTSMVILSTHSSPNMTYTPTTGLSSFARSDSLSKDTVSINSNGISGNAPREMSFITMNETLSTLLSNTLSKSVMLETSFTFSASIDTKHTISGFNTDLSKMQTVSLEETSTFNSTSIQSTQLSSSMTYALINLWSASTKLDVLSILKVNTNSTETSGYPSLETDSSSTELNQTFSEIFSLTSSTSLALETTSSFATLGKTESSYFGVNSKIQSVSSDESSILTSMVILSTHSSPNMTYTPTTGLSSFARSDSLSKDTVSINSNGISGNAPREMSFITMNETLSTLLSNTLSKSVMLETSFTFSASIDTKHTISGFNTDLSKMQMVSLEETSTFNSTSIQSTQLSSSMTYALINLWSASTKLDVLSILKVNTNSTETSGYPSLETDSSSTELNQTFSEIFSLTSSTSLALETTSSFATLGKTESSYFGVNSKIQSVSSDESSILTSMVILSTHSSPNMTYTPTTGLSSFARSDSLSKDTVSIKSNGISGNAQTETSFITMNETLSTLLSNTLSKSVMLETTFTFSASLDTKPTLSGFNTDLSKMQTVSSEESTTFNSTSIRSTQLYSTMTYTPINLWSASTKMDVLSILTVNTNGTEISGYPSLETGTSFTGLNQTFSEIVSLTSSTSLALETTSSFATLGKTESSYFGVDSKIQSVSSDESSILTSMVILSTHSSPNMTYTPTTGLSSFARSDSLSKDTVSIKSNGISGNAPTETSFITMNETLSTLLSNTLSKSVMLETTFTFYASLDTKPTLSGFNTDLSKMQTVSSEESTTFNSTSILSTQLYSTMTYTPINLWSASTKMDVLSILTVNTNGTEISGYPSLETGTSFTGLNQTFSEIVSLTSSTSLALETTSSFATLGKTESSYFGVDSKIQSVSSDESSILTSMVILSTHSSPNMTYTPTTGLSSFARSESLSKDTVSIKSNGISGNAPTETSFITMNETLSTLLSNTLSKSVMLETTFTFSASLDTKPTLSGFNTDLSKMQTVSSEESTTFNSTSIRSTQLYSTMTYTPINLWSASTKMDVLSILTVNTNGTEISGYPSLETGTSFTGLNQTFSEIVSLTSSTSLALETTSSFATLGKTESSYFGVDSKIQSVSSDESSILTSMVILSTHSSPNMTYTPTTGLSSFARSDSLSKDTVSIKSNGISGNAPTETSFITMNETLSTLLSNTLSKSVMLETTFTFSASLDTKPTLSGFNTDLSKMQTVSSEESTTFNSTSIRSTQLYSTMTYTPINLWSASTKMDVLSILTVNTNGTEISGYPSLETGTSFTGLNQTFSEIVSLTSSTSLALETTSSFATLGKTESSYFGVDSKIQSVSSDESSILTSMVILSTHSSPNMTYTLTTGLSSFARSNSLSKDTVSIAINEISGNAPTETETSSITMNETLSTLLSNTPSKSMMLETTFTFSASTDTKSAFLGLNRDTSKMQTVSSEESTTFNSTSIRSTQLYSAMTYTPINLWSASTKMDVLSILTVNTNGTEISGYPSLETGTSFTGLNQTFSKIVSLTSSTSLALETTSSFATLGKTESSYFGVDSKIQSVSSDESSILTSMVILSTHSSPNMTYTLTTGLSSFASSDSLSKDTVSITINEISGNAPTETETSSITMNETLSTLLSNTPSKSMMLETTFTFSASTDTKSAFLGLNRDTSKMQTVSSEETSIFNSTSIRSSQSSSSSGYYTYAFHESTQSPSNIIRNTISMEETSNFVHLSAASTIKVSVSTMYTYGIDWNVYTTRENENISYSPTISVLSSSVPSVLYGISTSSKAPDLGVIIGVVIGCVILLSFAVFCLLICSFKRKRRQTRSENSEDQVAGNVTEPSTSKMNILPLLQPFPEMTAPKPMAAKATFALQKWGPLPPITPQLDWIQEIGDSWKKKKKRKHKPENVQTEEGQDTILRNEDQTGETETGNSNETLGPPDDVISEKRQNSKKKKEKGATVHISTGDFAEREPIINPMESKEYNLPTDDITDNDETRKSSKNSVSGEHAEGARESLDNKAEKKKKRKKKHRRHDEDRQDEENVHGLNTKSEKTKKKKKRKHEMEMDDLLQKEFVQDSDRKEEKRTRKHAKAEEDLLQPESINDGDTKNEKRKKKKKKKHMLDVDKELEDECVDDEVEAKQNRHHVDSEYIFQGEYINDVDMTKDLKKYPKDRKGIKYKLETESSVSLEEKMDISNNTTTRHENDNEKEHQGESIDGIDKKAKLERKHKLKQRLDLLDEKTHSESAELGNKAEAIDKVQDPASLGDFATDVCESEVVSSEYVAYISEKKKKKMKHPSQEVERENTQSINDITVEPDVKRRKRKTRHRAAPMVELNSSDEDFLITRNKSHTEGDRGFTTSKHEFERKEESEIVQNGKVMDYEKAKDSTSLGDLVTDVRTSEVKSSEDEANRSEKKKKKKHPLQEVERENTQTATADIVEPDAKRIKRKKRHRAVPMTELDSSEEDVIRPRNKLHTEGDRAKTSAKTKDQIVFIRPDKQSIEDNTPRPITSEINKDIAEIKMKPKITFVELERTQSDFVQDTLKENNEELNVTTIEGESFA